MKKCIISFILILIGENIIMAEKYSLEQYKKDVIKNYCNSIGLPENYSFSNGKQVEPLPPVETTKNGVFIVGAYPSAKFDRDGKKTIPIDNLKKPFDDEIYIKDGVKNRNKSGEELEEKYLKPLGILRNKCWITNLVKVFLFKKGHYENELDSISERANFEQYAQKSLCWLDKEIEIAEPKIIITLGNEVAGIIGKVKGNNKRNDLLKKYEIKEITINNRKYKIIHMVHPGILMRNNEKWSKVHNEGIERLKPKINSILKNN
ncbi:MAG: uracil-DNA glycosylase family protein [Candidatus Firestonebacteria bacterium]